MTDFDALLKRSFAEAPEPVDDGFSVKIGHEVARRERFAKLRQVTHQVGMATAGAAILYGGYVLATTFGQQVLATVGLEVAQAQMALSNAPSVSQGATGLLNSLGASLSTVLLIAAALAGGAVAYRATQQD